MFDREWRAVRWGHDRGHVTTDELRERRVQLLELRMATQVNRRRRPRREG